MSAIYQQLAALLLPQEILSEPAGLLTDQRRRYTGTADLVLQPQSVEAVKTIMRFCFEHRIPVTPQGGNTGLCGAAVPRGGVLLNLSRLNRIRSISTADNAITVEAGCVLHDVQQAAEGAGRFFPLSLASEGSCQIGGNIACNAGGLNVLRYGTMRDLVMGLEVVLPNGELVSHLHPLHKDTTGYDLRQLFVGSEGTLGIITAATLKVYPQPAARLTAWAAVPSMQAAVNLLGLAQKRLSAGLTGFEVMNQFALSLVDKHHPQLRTPLWRDSPWCVLLENSDYESEDHARALFERLLEEALEAGCVSDAVVAESMAQAKNLWHIRESIPLAQADEGLNIKHDISVPISRIPAFVEATDALLQAEIAGVRLVNFGHLGDGNLHYNVQAPEGGDPKEFLRTQEARINHIVYDSVQAHGGSISAEHGIGSLKAEELPRYKSPVALQTMRAIKAALDPLGLMNPGRVLG